MVQVRQSRRLLLLNLSSYLRGLKWRRRGPGPLEGGGGDWRVIVCKWF